MILNQSVIQELFDYNPETGEFISKPRDMKYFKSEKDHKMWHTRFCGKISDRLDSKGYKRVYVLNKDYRVHILIWLWMTGEFCKNQIDHINCLKNDNKWSNLREANNSQNCSNQNVRKNNKLGFKGVHKLPSGRYKAAITKFYKRFDIGIFDTPEEASRAYIDASRKIFGEFHHRELEKYD